MEFSIRKLNPSDYDDLPQLKGRATVEMTVKKAEGENFDIEGKLFKEANMKMIIDGYTGKLYLAVVVLLFVCIVTDCTSHFSVMQK